MWSGRHFLKTRWLSFPGREVEREQTNGKSFSEHDWQWMVFPLTTAKGKGSTLLPSLPWYAISSPATATCILVGMVASHHGWTWEHHDCYKMTVVWGCVATCRHMHVKIKKTKLLLEACQSFIRNFTPWKISWSTPLIVDIKVSC